MRDPGYGERHLAAMVSRRLRRAHPAMLVHNALVRVIVSLAMELLAEEFPNTARMLIDRRRRREPGQIRPTPEKVLGALHIIYASARARALAKEQTRRELLRVRRLPAEAILTPEEFVALTTARREAHILGLSHRETALKKAIRALRV